MTTQQGQTLRLDWTVNLGFALGLLLQFVGFTWYAAKLDERVTTQDQRLIKTEIRLQELDRDLLVRVARLEEKMAAILSSLQRVEKAIDARP